MIGDPSAFGARTALAWRRTGFSLLAAAIVIGRGIGPVDGNAGAGLIVAALALIVWMSALVGLYRRRGATAAAAKASELAPLAVTTAVAGLIVLVVAITA